MNSELINAAHLAGCVNEMLSGNYEIDLKIAEDGVLVVGSNHDFEPAVRFIHRVTWAQIANDVHALVWAVGYVGGVLQTEPEPKPGQDEERSKAPLVERLADCLAEIVDTPLLSIGDPIGGYQTKMDVYLGGFQRVLSEQACLLLEEAGR